MAKETKMTLTKSELDKLVAAVKLRKNPGIYLITGDMSAGKTTLVKSFVKELGCDANVTSPTYSLKHEYAHGINHYDICQKDLKSLFSAGFLEEIDTDGWHFIEWGDSVLSKVLGDIGLLFYEIDIAKIQKDCRNYTLRGF